MDIIIFGAPRTKKNSQQITRHGLIQSAAYRKYERDSMLQIFASMRRQIDTPVNVQCLYYMPTLGKVDLCNLLAATCDILVKSGVLADDNSRIVAGHDGSRVLYDKDNPRAEIYIRQIS